MSINLLNNLPGPENEGRQQAIGQSRTARRIWFVVAGLILLASFIVPSMLEPGSTAEPGVGLIDVGVGLILAGPFLCALYCALMEFTLAARLSGGLAGFTFQVLALAAGVGFAGYPEPLSMDWLAAVPCLFLAVCLPFLLARLLFGWQIRFPRFFPGQPPPRVSTAGLMIFTAAFAFCVAALSSSEIWLVEDAILVSLGGIGGGMALVIPVVLVVMRPARYGVGFSVSSLVPFPIAVALLAALGWELERCLSAAATLSVGLVTINICLVAARLAGGRLQTNSDLEQENRGSPRSGERPV